MRRCTRMPPRSTPFPIPATGIPGPVRRDPVRSAQTAGLTGRRQPQPGDPVSVIVAPSGVHSRFDDLMATAGNGPGATLGQRLYIARGRARLSTKEAANGVGLRKDLIEGVEAEESVLEDEASRIKDLIAALGG